MSPRRSTIGQRHFNTCVFCAGAIQQQQSAWHLNRVCKTRGCQFIINTSDNLCARVPDLLLPMYAREDGGSI